MPLYANPVDKPTSLAGASAKTSSASNGDKLPNAWLEDAWDPGATGRFSESTRLVELIPLYQTRLLRLLLYWLTIIGLIVALGTVGVPALRTFNIPVPDCIRLDKLGLAVWLGSVLLLLSTWISQLIYSLRRRKPNCCTRGRIWILAGLCWLYMSFDKMAHCGMGINAIIQSLWGDPATEEGDWMGLALIYGLILLFLAARLVFEMQGTLAAQFSILAAMLGYVSAGAVWFIPEEAWIIPIPVEAAANSAILLGDFLIFWAVLLYCRFLLLDGFGLLGAGWNEALKRYRQRKKAAKNALKPELNSATGTGSGGASGTYVGTSTIGSAGYGTGIGATSGTASGYTSEYTSGSTPGGTIAGIGGTGSIGHGSTPTSAVKPIGTSGTSSINKAAHSDSASSTAGKLTFSFWGKRKTNATGPEAKSTAENNLLSEPINDLDAAYDSDINWQDSPENDDYNTEYDNNDYADYENNESLVGTGNGANGYGNGANGYGNGVNGYGNGANGYGNGANGYGNGANGYGNGTNGYGNGANGYGNGTNGYGNGTNGYGNGTNGYGNGNGYGTTTTAIAGRPVSGNSGGYPNQNYPGQNRACNHTTAPQPTTGSMGRSGLTTNGSNGGYIPQNRPNNGPSGYVPQNNPVARSQGYAPSSRPAGTVTQSGYSRSGTVPAQNGPAKGTPVNGTRPVSSAGMGAASQVRSQNVGPAPSGSGATPSGTAPRRQLNPIEVQEELRKIEVRWGRKLTPDERKRIIKRLLG